MSDVDRAAFDAHIQTLRSFMVADRERSIARDQALADRAAAFGDLERQRWYLDCVARARATPYPWDTPKARTACCCGAHASHAEPPRG